MKIQLDSDSTMQGGVIPDIRVPINDSVVDQLYIDSTDVELNWAIRELNSMIGIEEHNSGPAGVILEEIVPNPVRSSATISYRIDEAAKVTLSVYDPTGKLVKTLVDGQQQAGSYSVIWNAGSEKPGVYLFRIRTGKANITRKCVVL
jgi:hypothetical protein